MRSRNDACSVLFSSFLKKCTLCSMLYHSHGCMQTSAAKVGCFSPHHSWHLRTLSPTALLSPPHLLILQLGMPASQQQWFYRNKLMNDEHTLERVGVIHDSIIEVRPVPSQSSSSRSTASPAELSIEAFHTEHSREVWSCGKCIVTLCR